MTAIATRAPSAHRPTWGQAFWAVIGGTIFGSLVTLVLLLPLWAIGLPVPFLDEGTSGRGWPWRVDGLWSLAADVGPLLIAGYGLSFGTHAFLRRHTDVAAPFTPLAVTAAAVGWVTIAPVSGASVLGVSGLAAFIALVVVARESSIREGRWRWTRTWAVLALGAGFGLAGASLSYGYLHPLTAGSDEAGEAKRGRVTVPVFLRNDGRADVRVLAVTVPRIEVDARRYTDRTYAPGDYDSVLAPVTGMVLGGNTSDHIELQVPCVGASRTIDRVDVRMRVHARELNQTVRLAPVFVGRCG